MTVTAPPPVHSGMDDAAGFVAAPNRLCTSHAGLCAYDPADEARCSMCHASWRTILLSEWHSCETAFMARQQNGNLKVARARQMRMEAAQRLREGTLSLPRPHLSLSSGKAPDEAPNSPTGEA
jgi:hypothetical protein